MADGSQGRMLWVSDADCDFGMRKKAKLEKWEQNMERH